ncbi:MAG: acyl phosphate:glycerol-3-phosphate acyltransferase [Rhodospirillaceae bacterium]|nr:acyl phosphate:glycerol-3-phosphate acyltransferase [Rhodospirillaceae bacterium]
MPALLAGIEYTWPYYLGALGGYLLGSIPFGLLLTRIAGLGDIRKIGSGNIGATNVLRTGRKGLAAATLLLDGGKGAAAVLIARHWGPDMAILAGAGALIGHLFPLWLRFRGGKGVATGLGVLLALDWRIGLIACAVWLIAAFLFRYSSLAALLAFAAGPVAALLLSTRQLAAVALFLGVLVWLRHHQNIGRLLRGAEPRIKLRRDVGSN